MKLLQLGVAVVLVGVVTSSELLDVTENDALHRYKRAWKNEKRKVGNCQAGERAVVACVKCPVGYYVQEVGLWKDCVKCPKGKTSLADNPNRCVPICPAGKTWDSNPKKKICKTAKGTAKAIARACCKVCPANTFKEDAGNNECNECPRFWKPNPKFTACKLRCPAGYEPRTLPDDTHTCAPCKFGHYKGSGMRACRPCPNDGWTLTTGSTAVKECIAEISDLDCNAAFPTLVNALEEYAYDMTVNDTLGEVLCNKSLVICELRSAILACINATDPSTGKQLLPAYQDYDKSVNLTSIITHTPWCIIIYLPMSPSSSAFSTSSGFSSSSSSGFSSSSSHVYSWNSMFGSSGSIAFSTTIGFSSSSSHVWDYNSMFGSSGADMFGSSGSENEAGMEMENVRIGGPGKEAWQTDGEPAIKILPMTELSSNSLTSYSTTQWPVAHEGPQCFQYNYYALTRGDVEPTTHGDLRSGSGGTIKIGANEP